MNIIAQLEFELTHYDSAVHHFNPYTTRTYIQICIYIYICMVYVCIHLKIHHKCLYLYIIIMLHNQHKYPWPSLTPLPYRPLLPAGPQGYIPYWHRAAVCRFELVVLPLLTHVKWPTSLMSLYQFLQQRPACLVHLILIVSVMGGRCPYSCCFVGCCLHDLFNIARSILV